MTPENLLYNKTHEWVRVEDRPAGEKIATVGLTDFALKALTDLVYLELPKPGRQVQAGEAMGEVESVKAVSDIYGPVTGEVVESNAAIAANLGDLAKDPYGDGWLVKIRVSDSADLSKLLDHAAYQKQIEQEGSES
jgi:glycine cleavage system H protein